MLKKIVIRGAVILSVMLLIIWMNLMFLDIGPEEFRIWILSYGWFAPIFYILLYTFRPLILFPASIFTIVGGLAFGLPFGIIYALLGATSGAVFSFFISRRLGPVFLKKQPSGLAKSISKQLETRGFFYILGVRLLPIINFDLISYVAGVSKVRFKSYFFATFLGIIPGTIAYNFVGASFVRPDRFTITVALGLFVLLVIIPLAFSKILKSRLEPTSIKK
ncbi:TVP38/TMEM64 family protein [Bacillus solitudinis]|uniref:TVP38/TMEM64 family protein n=1 Tax=Bacillus solitudinis TaxID=2014074 RepID=UPI001D0D563C|nr:TVP38/TMEM64 family protein [Bacillus solitudinis]